MERAPAGPDVVVYRHTFNSALNQRWVSVRCLPHIGRRRLRRRYYLDGQISRELLSGPFGLLLFVRFRF